MAEDLGLSRQTRMLDVGCGPGNLAIGFAPFSGSVTGIDKETVMLRYAREAAANAHVQVNFVETAIEVLNVPDASIDFITVGRALHWLTPDATLAIFNRILSNGGYIAICGSTATGSPVNGWTAAYNQLRRTWAPDYDEKQHRVDLDAWFAPSRFRKAREITVEHRHTVAVDDLVRRALSFSITSPAVLGDRRPQFEAEVRQALMPISRDGWLEEELVAKATIFR